MIHCWRDIKSYGRVGIPVEGYSKYLLLNIQVQSDIYTHVIWVIVYYSI